MGLSVNLIAKILATRSDSIDGVAANLFSFNDRDPIPLADGTGASQADRIWSDTRTLTASASEELDLNALVHSDPLSNVNMVKIKAILIVASSVNTNDVVVGNAAATQFQGGFGAVTHTWAIAPGDFFFVSKVVSGWSCANGVADKLKLANSAGSTSVTYTIYIIGTSA